ncbi:hypothetical protein [Kiloniella sp.]|uniref:hypothetical protein n=1 Tax=Kiloniella sp. TaxID=1938587 RepID=UPI003A901CE7
MIDNADESLKKWQDSVQAWAAITKENAEIDVLVGMLTSIASASPIIDKFSTWLLAGSAGIGSLFILNLDRLVPIINSDRIQWALFFLIPSAIFGVFSKLNSLSIQTGVHSTQRMKEILLPIIEKHMGNEDEIGKAAKESNSLIDMTIDFKKIMNEFIDCYPFPVRYFIKKYQKDEDFNQVSAPKKWVRSLIWQSFNTSIQFICVLVFAIVLISGINII